MPAKLNEREMPLLLGDPDTQATVLLTILLWAFGDTVAGDEPMEPAELWKACHERFGVWIPEEGENKVNAIITAMRSDNFYLDPETFTALCMSLTSGDMGDIADGVMEELEAFEAAWGCIEVMLARHDDETVEFSPSVRALFEEAMARDTAEHVNSEVTVELNDMKARLARLGVEDHHVAMLGL